MIFSPLPDVHIPDNVSLSNFVLEDARKYGDRVAMELESQCRDSKTKYIFTLKEGIPKVEEVQRKYELLQGVITPDGAFGTWSYLEFIKDDGSAYPNVKIDVHNDVAVLPYSSGTTGKPKGVMLTHYNLVANMCQTSHPDFGVFFPESRYVFPLPFFHIYGIVVCMLQAVKTGHFVAILPQYNLKSYLTAVEKYKCGIIYAVPPMLVQLAKDPLVSDYDLSAVTHIFCGAAPTSNEVLLACKKRFPNVKNTTIAYGMTELSPLATSTLLGRHVEGSVGVPIPNTVVKIVNPETNEHLGPNEDGEIVVKGPQIMKGYLGNQKATLATIDKDGWLHTGDLGHYDRKGHFYVMDRMKELIKYKAYQVAPAELEDLLLKMSGVADAAVIGVPDDQSGELPRAFVVKKQGVQITESDVIKHVQDHVSPQKRLRGGVEFVDAIPKSPSGKILRRLIKDKFRQRMKAKL